LTTSNFCSLETGLPSVGEQKNFFAQIWLFFSKTCSAQRDESNGTTFRLFGEKSDFALSTEGSPVSRLKDRFLYLEIFSLFFRPRQNPTNYIYSESARRDESNGTIFSVIGDGRKKVEKFSKYRNRPLSLETGLPSVGEQKKFFSPNGLKVVPFDSSRCAEQDLLKNSWFREKKFFCSLYPRQPCLE